MQDLEAVYFYHSSRKKLDQPFADRVSLSSTPRGTSDCRHSNALSRGLEYLLKAAVKGIKFVRDNDYPIRGTQRGA